MAPLPSSTDRVRVQRRRISPDAQYQGMHFTGYNYLMAASVISMIPALMVFVAAQRHLIRGIAFSGLKN